MNFYLQFLFKFYWSSRTTYC